MRGVTDERSEVTSFWGETNVRDGWALGAANVALSGFQKRPDSIIAAPDSPTQATTMKLRFARIYLVVLVVCTAITASAQTNVVQMKLDDETHKLLRAVAEDKWFKRDVLFSTLLGGLLAIAGGVGASCVGHWLQARHKNREGAEFEANVLRAIRRELEAIGKIYDEGIGAIMKDWPGGTAFTWRLGVTQDWFTVFNANAVNLGKIEAEASRRVVGIYVMNKKLIEEYRINNDYLTALERVTAESQGRTYGSTNVDWLKGMMVKQVTRIKDCEKTLKADVSGFMALLDERGIK